jgi:hypothetical protein
MPTPWQVLEFHQSLRTDRAFIRPTMGMIEPAAAAPIDLM